MVRIERTDAQRDQALATQDARLTIGTFIELKLDLLVRRAHA